MKTDLKAALIVRAWAAIIVLSSVSSAVYQIFWWPLHTERDGLLVHIMDVMMIGFLGGACTAVLAGVVVIGLALGIRYVITGRAL